MKNLNESGHQSLQELLDYNGIPVEENNLFMELAPIAGAAAMMVAKLVEKSAYGVAEVEGASERFVIEIPEKGLDDYTKVLKATRIEKKRAQVVLTINGNEVVAKIATRIFSKECEKVLTATALLLAKDVPLTAEAVEDFFAKGNFSYEVDSNVTQQELDTIVGENPRGTFEKTSIKRPAPVAAGYVPQKRNRVFTAEEQAMMDNNTFSFAFEKSAQTESVTKLIERGLDSDNELTKNALLMGEPGGGKTEYVRHMAMELGLPYVAYTCSPNMDVSDLYGTFVPQGNFEAETTTLLKKLVGFVAGVSKKLANLFKISDDTAALAGKVLGNTGAGRFTFVESPIVKALRNGWVLEIQEGANILNPGVLATLNGLLDKGQKSFLPNGDQLVRHKDAIVVFTTNVNCRGCEAFNEALMSRCGVKTTFHMPDKKGLVKRTKGNIADLSKETSDLLPRMAETFFAVRTYVKTNDLDGNIGTREFFAWVNATETLGDVVLAAEYSLVPSATMDEDEQKKILASLITTKF